MCDVCEPRAQERDYKISSLFELTSSREASLCLVYLALSIYRTAVHDTYRSDVSLTYPRATHVHVDAKSLLPTYLFRR